MSSHSLLPDHLCEPLTLVQNRNGSESRYTLTSNDSLQIETRSTTRQQAYSIEISMLAPNPSRESAKSGWFNGSVFYFLVATVFFSVPMALSLYLGELWAAAAFGAFGPLPLTIFTIIEIRKQLRKGFDIVVYHSRFGGGAALIIEANTPDSESVARFRSELEKRIDLGTSNLASTKSSDSISAQILEIHHLVKQGILTEDEFTSVKARLLSGTERVERQIGFATGDES